MNLSKFTEKFKPGKSTKAATNGSDEVIEFVCQEKLYDVIPEPLPANKVLPDWYRELNGKMGPGLSQSTVKRCAPFLDAITMGWIIPLAGEIEFHYNTETGEYDADQKFSETLIDHHDSAQIGGENNPLGHLPVLKFVNHWAMKVPDGYSVLVIPPLNRFEPRFQVFSGVVDADNYFNQVNFPFVWTGGDFHGVIERGTPMVQVIPFKRDGIIGDGTIRSMTSEEALESGKDAGRINSEESFYRNNLWEPKKGSRVVDKDEPDDSDDSGCPFH